MRAVVQRVKECTVSTDFAITGKIGRGLLVLLGIAKSDQRKDADYLADKVVNLRIFEDADGRMNRSLIDVKGEMLVVSQFTLLGDCRKGRRPSFIDAAEPEKAKEMYDYFIETILRMGVSVETGRFRAKMDVALINEGPVTILVESR